MSKHRFAKHLGWSGQLVTVSFGSAALELSVWTGLALNFWQSSSTFQVLELQLLSSHVWAFVRVHKQSTTEPRPSFYHLRRGLTRLLLFMFFFFLR